MEVERERTVRCIARDRKAGGVRKRGRVRESEKGRSRESERPLSALGQVGRPQGAGSGTFRFAKSARPGNGAAYTCLYSASTTSSFGLPSSPGLPPGGVGPPEPSPAPGAAVL